MAMVETNIDTGSSDDISPPAPEVDSDSKIALDLDTSMLLGETIDTPERTEKHEDKCDPSTPMNSLTPAPDRKENLKVLDDLDVEDEEVIELTLDENSAEVTISPERVVHKQTDSSASATSPSTLKNDIVKTASDLYPSPPRPIRTNKVFSPEVQRSINESIEEKVEIEIEFPKPKNLSKSNVEKEVDASMETKETMIGDSFTSEDPQEVSQGNISAAFALPNQLFADALDEVTDLADEFTDLAVDLGIVVDPSSPPRTPNRPEIVAPQEELKIETEEPGKIFSAASYDEPSPSRTRPFDEYTPERNNRNSEPFDEMSPDPKSRNSEPFDEIMTPDRHVSVGSSRRDMEEREMSAIARMRFLEAVGKSPKANVEEKETKSYEEIQKEKYEKWQNMREIATREEATLMNLTLGNTDNASVSGSETSSLIDSSVKQSSNKKDKKEEESEGLFSISEIMRVGEKVWNQSSAAIMDTILGPAYSDDEDSVYSHASSHYDSECDSVSVASSKQPSPRRRKTKSRNIPRTKDREQQDDDSEVDLDEIPEIPTTINQHINNSSFLEDITGEGIELDWHRPRSSPGSRLVYRVRLNIQISNDGGDAEPRLVWEAIDVDSRNGQKTVKNECIALFSIVSIQRASDSINLNAFPNAIADHSILITMYDSKCVLFEAADMEDARRLIHGLKWIAARFTFNVIVGNISVCSEMLSTSIDGMYDASNMNVDVFDSVTNELVQKTLNISS